MYQNGRNGECRKLFVHKTSHFTEEERRGALTPSGTRPDRSWLSDPALKMVWVKWMDPAARAAANARIPLTGPLSTHDARRMGTSLWTQGGVSGVNVKALTSRCLKRGCSQALLLILLCYAGSRVPEAGMIPVPNLLALTKVRWNNNTLYKTFEVVGLFPVVADVVKQSLISLIKL